MTRFAKLVAAGALCVGASACAANGIASSDRPLPPEGPTAKVEVQNDVWQNMTVYLEGTGMHARLGVVDPMQRAVFHIPVKVLTERNGLRLVAVAKGSPRPIHIGSLSHVWAGQVSTYRIDDTRMPVGWAGMGFGN